MVNDIAEMACPPDDALVAFGHGALPAAQLEELAEHLSSCRACEARMTQLDGATDDLLAGLQRGKAGSTGLRPGETLGEYEVVALIGRGGMARVWKARHRRMNRIVAIKVMAGTSASAAMFGDRFQREVEVLANLNHPNIAVAYDAGEYHGCPYLVMEFLDGEDLGQRLAAGPLPVTEACAAVLQAARGLAYAHERGLVHRDVKPANLFRLRDGTIKLLDLGLVRQVDQIEAASVEAVSTLRNGLLTSATTVMGTLDYMAPEQKVSAANVDARADIFSLGCTLYALLRGQSPFGRDMKPKPLAEVQQVVPVRISKLVESMLVLDPAKRCPSMAVVISELEACQDKPRRRYWLAAAGVLLALAASLAVIWPPGRDRGAAKDSSSSRVPVKPVPEKLTQVMTPVSAAEFQSKWAAELGVPLIEQNSIGMEMALIPPGLIGELKLFCPQPIRVGVVPVTMRHYRTFAKATNYQSEIHRKGNGTIVVQTPGSYNYRFESGPKSNWENPGFDEPFNDYHPVVQLTWNDAMEFCDWLSTKEGCRYRLPTPGEYLWFTRCGTKTEFYAGTDPASLRPHEFTRADGLTQPKEVGRKKPNPWGLQDTLGNVRVWTSDWTDTSQQYRAFTGGCFLDEPTMQIGKAGWLPVASNSLMGFRIVKEFTPP